MELISALSGMLIPIFAFLAAIGIVVFVHEAGHYIAARVSGIEVTVFSIGFGPALIKKMDRNGTEWRLSLLPVGGYVRFNEGDDLNQPAKPGAMAFPEAHLWRRTATVIAGPLANFIASVVIFIALALFIGIPRDEVIIDSLKTLPFSTGELSEGDKIVAIGDHATEDYSRFIRVASETPPDINPFLYTIERKGRVGEVEGPHPMPAIINRVIPNSAAAEAGLRTDDVILSINGQTIITFSQVGRLITDSDGRELNFKIWRDGQSFMVSLRGQEQELILPGGDVEKKILIGVNGGRFFETATRRAHFTELLQIGVGQTAAIVEGTVRGLVSMVRGKISTCHIQGPIGIARISGAAAEQGPITFIHLIALLSTAIGFINLIPIPGLDGGHLAFYLYESVVGKAPPESLMKIMLSLGVIMLILLLIFSTFNDLTC